MLARGLGVEGLVYELHSTRASCEAALGMVEELTGKLTPGRHTPRPAPGRQGTAARTTKVEPQEALHPLVEIKHGCRRPCG